MYLFLDSFVFLLLYSCLSKREIEEWRGGERGSEKKKQQQKAGGLEFSLANDIDIVLNHTKQSRRINFFFI